MAEPQPPAEPDAAAVASDQVKVSTLELFFDLVFVFTLTQLTAILASQPTGAGLVRVSLMLVVIWWMYGGYAWLTNVVAPDRFAYQLLLLGGMSAFLVLSLAIPTAFRGGLAFGLAYLVIVLIHAGLFTRSRAGESGLAIRTVAPLNVTAAILITVAGIVGDTAAGVLWGLAVAVIVLPSLRPPDPRFQISPDHFVERHGLVVIIALGESVVAVGIGASAHPLSLGLVAVAVLGLALTACLWWCYFGEAQDEKALAAMRAASGRERSRLALFGFYHWHLLILMGIIALASALERAIDHPLESLQLARSGALAGGAAAFLVGDALFRRTLGTGASGWRLAAAALALACVPLGHAIAAVVELAALVAVLLLCLWLERYVGRRDRVRPGRLRRPQTGYHG